MKLSLGVKSDPVELREVLKRIADPGSPKVIVAWDGELLPAATSR